LQKVQAQAAILAGGQGTRMRLFTREPKALLPVSGRPLMAHQLEWLKKSGFQTIFLCLGYGAERIREVFGDGSAYGVRLHYSVESAPRGTAGAVRDLPGAVDHDWLVVYGDLIVSVDAPALHEAHRAGGAAATMVVRPTDHPEDSDLADVSGDGTVSWVGRFDSAPPVSGARLGCCAVWALRGSLLARVPLDRPSDFARDLFPAAIAAGEAMRAFRVEEGVLDIGTPERYRRFIEETGAS